MNTIDCETVLMAAMSVADGSPAEIETARIEAHLAQCGNCRSELEALGGLAKLLDAQKRRQSDEQLWSTIQPRLSDRAEAQPADRTLKMWAPVGLILLAYKLFEQVSDRQLALVYKLLPLLLIAAAFLFLRQNPFKINTELKLEGE
ncbi:MAG TPA: zf-HC2 domain-containing protein [Blastocatellia bacterium]|jgi:predicted anti-sigma-YlaC factor YlaD|nr:zf-HC2 domain-containing protein [Blastocatellia bacterium]